MKNTFIQLKAFSFGVTAMTLYRVSQKIFRSQQKVSRTPLETIASGRSKITINGIPQTLDSLDSSYDNVGTGYVGLQSYGDITRFQIKVENGKITDAKLKFCNYFLSKSEFSMDSLKGKTIEEASRLDFADIAKDVAPLPPVMKHSLLMAEVALKAAISNYMAKQKKSF